MKDVPDGFVCSECGRNVYHMALAPLCGKCRSEAEGTQRMLRWYYHPDRYDINVRPTKRSGWWLICKLTWDALFARKSKP